MSPDRAQSEGTGAEGTRGGAVKEGKSGVEVPGLVMENAKNYTLESGGKKSEV